MASGRARRLATQKQSRMTRRLCPTAERRCHWTPTAGSMANTLRKNICAIRTRPCSKSKQLLRAHLWKHDAKGGGRQRRISFQEWLRRIRQSVMLVSVDVAKRLELSLRRPEESPASCWYFRVGQLTAGRDGSAALLGPFPTSPLPTLPHDSLYEHDFRSRIPNPKISSGPSLRTSEIFFYWGAMP
jgi:hypothetical protein